ncbi:MAG: hypothetical protein E7812_00210 [Phenylobacterium sp.]|nr:MAG: hypothetical protein E7812_00210 [Phenylobacterium sp.]
MTGVHRGTTAQVAYYSVSTRRSGGRHVLKKLVTFRFDPELLKRIRSAAEAENRTLTNFVETTLKRALLLDEAAGGPPAPIHSDLPH